MKFISPVSCIVINEQIAEAKIQNHLIIRRVNCNCESHDNSVKVKFCIML